MPANRLQSFLMAPLQGKTSLSKVIWLYGVVGSLLYGAIEFFIDPNNGVVMRAYIIAGLIFSVYVTLGTYYCAVNCRSPLVAKLVRVSALVTLLLLPFLTYLELTGALSLNAIEGMQMPE